MSGARRPEPEGAVLRALEQVPALIAILRGPDLVYAYVNAAYARMVLIDAPVGKPFGASGHETTSELRALLKRVYETGEPVAIPESRIRQEDTPGVVDERFYDVSFIPLRDDAGSVDGVMIHSFDVTELVRARQRILKDEAQLRRLSEANLLGIGFFEGNELVDANDELLRILGYDRDDLRAGRLVWSKLTPPEHAESTARALRELSATGAYAPFEKEYVRRDGTRAPVLVGGAAFDGQRKSGAAFVLDLSERRRAEERNAELQAKLLHVQKLESLGVLAGGIAHDFNNLLAGVLGNVSASALMVPPNDPAQEPLSGAIAGIRRASDLTRQLLAYAGKGRLRVEPVDLSTQVREVSALLRASVPKSVTFTLDLADGLPAVVADVTQLHQLIMNLVINAAEAITRPDGRVRVTTRLEQIDPPRAAALFETGEVAPGEYVALEVQDTGSGMDEATKQRIFDPFFTTKFTGRGLGLASTLGIVRGHRGAIELKSRLGEGTTFRVLFPVADEPASTPAAHAVDDYRGTGSVLVVDDDDRVRRATERLLEMFGFDVVGVSRGLEAIKVFSTRPAAFVVVLLDMTMPEMSGEETLRALRAVRADVPVIVTSGYDEDDAARTFTTHAPTAFLHKPFTVAELVSRLRIALAPGRR